MKFLVDAMLKKLARWLRILGVKALYPERIEDNAILALAKRERAVLLTQDVELAERARKKGLRVFLVPRAPIEEQLASVLSEFKISIGDFPSKTLCPKCNGRLKRVSAREVQALVPKSIASKHKHFWLCESCSQVYWEGSHWKRIVKTAEKVKEMIE